MSEYNDFRALLEGATMIKSELIQKIAAANQHLYHRDIERIVNVVFNEIVEALSRGDRVELRGFGAFTVKHRAPRVGRNPRTGAAVSVAEKFVPFFKTGKDLRERLNEEKAAGSRQSRTISIARGPSATAKELQVLRRAWKYVLGVPAAIIILTLAVINRHGVRLVLDPFRPDEPVLSLVLPFYAYLIGMLVICIVIGG